MSYSPGSSPRIDPDLAFKLFGLVGIAIGVLLTVLVIALSFPFETFGSASSITVATILFTMILFVVGGATYLSRPQHEVDLEF